MAKVGSHWYFLKTPKKAQILIPHLSLEEKKVLLTTRGISFYFYYFCSTIYHNISAINFRTFQNDLISRGINLTQRLPFRDSSSDSKVKIGNPSQT